jgi:hypothetical protein
MELRLMQEYPDVGCGSLTLVSPPFLVLPVIHPSLPIVTLWYIRYTSLIISELRYLNLQRAA